MMKNIRVEWHESGLIISQEGVSECVTVPEILKNNFYEDLLTACLNNQFTDYNDINGNEITLNPNPENTMSCFINNVYSGELDYVLLNENSIGIPVETGDTEQLYEIFDSGLAETYLLYESELLF